MFPTRSSTCCKPNQTRYDRLWDELVEDHEYNRSSWWFFHMNVFQSFCLAASAGWYAGPSTTIGVWGLAIDMVVVAALLLAYWLRQPYEDEGQWKRPVKMLLLLAALMLAALGICGSVAANQAKEAEDDSVGRSGGPGAASGGLALLITIMSVVVLGLVALMVYKLCVSFWMVVVLRELGTKSFSSLDEEEEAKAGAGRGASDQGRQARAPTSARQKVVRSLSGRGGKNGEKKPSSRFNLLNPMHSQRGGVGGGQGGGAGGGGGGGGGGRFGVPGGASAGGGAGVGHGGARPVPGLKTCPTASGNAEFMLNHGPAAQPTKRQSIGDGGGGGGGGAAAAPPPRRNRLAAVRSLLRRPSLAPKPLTVSSSPPAPPPHLKKNGTRMDWLMGKLTVTAAPTASVGNMVGRKMTKLGESVRDMFHLRGSDIGPIEVVDEEFDDEFDDGSSRSASPAPMQSSLFGLQTIDAQEPHGPGGMGPSVGFRTETAIKLRETRSAVAQM